MIASELADVIIQFVHAHESWAAPVVFFLAFSESFAFISLVVPATVVLFAIGGLFGAADVEFWPVYAAGLAGAFAGDWLAYEMAIYFGHSLASVWPLSKHPEVLQRGFILFRTWGSLIVFVGRFFGPFRAAVPIVAGIVRMPRLQFQLANFGSAVVWAAGVLTPGMLGLDWLFG